MPIHQMKIFFVSIAVTLLCAASTGAQQADVDEFARLSQANFEKYKQLSATVRSVNAKTQVTKISKYWQDGNLFREERLDSNHLGVTVVGTDGMKRSLRKSSESGKVIQANLNRSTRAIRIELLEHTGLAVPTILTTNPLHAIIARPKNKTKIVRSPESIKCTITQDDMKVVAVVDARTYFTTRLDAMPAVAT